MKIAILTRKRTLYSTRRLKEEAEKLGHKVILLDPFKCAIYLQNSSPSLLYKAKVFDAVKAVIPRIGTFAIDHSAAIVRQFRLMGTFCLNDDEAILKTKNKLSSLQYLVSKGIKVPDTLITKSSSYFQKLLNLVGGTPIVLKFLSGTQGTGVVLSETIESAKSSLEAVWSLGLDMMMQKFVSESKGRDIRALVLGDKVLAAMNRIATQDEFRSNIHRGAIGKAVSLSHDQEQIALKAAKALGLLFAGVDMLESEDGSLVIEVNASAGFQGLEAASGQNIARSIIDFTVGSINAKL